MSHLDEMTCLLYVDGQLEPERSQELAAHLESCAECRSLLAALEREEGWLRAALSAEEEALPVRLLERSAPQRPRWGWITAFGLAAAGFYTLWNGTIEPLRQQFSQAGFSGGNLLTVLFFGGAFWKGWETMTSWVEFFALATLGVAALALLRRNWRRWTMVAAVLSSIFLVLATASPASAAEIRKGDPNFTLSAGQTVKNDLIVAAQSAHIEGDVDGDLIVFAQSLTVNGHVAGDVLAFVRELRVNGSVGGNVRSFVQSLFLAGSVERNVTCWCGHFEQDPKSQVGGSVTIGVGNAELNGRVARDLLAFAGSTDLNGYLGGNVLLRGGKLNIGSGAEIQGHIKYYGAHPPRVASGAKLASAVQFIQRHRRPRYASPRFYWHQVLFWCAAFVFGLILYLVVPTFFADAVRASRRFGASLGVGALAVIATPIAAVLACVTLVGIPAGLAALFLFVLAVYSAQVYVGTWLGDVLLGQGSGTGAILGRMALGLLIFRVARNLPYIGAIIALLVVLWGVGALGLAIYRRMRPQAVAA